MKFNIFINIRIVSIELLLVFIIIANIECSGQKRPPQNYGVSMKYSPGLILYDKKTASIIDNQSMFSWEAAIFYNRFMIVGNGNHSFKDGNYIQKPISLNGKELNNNQEVKLTLNSLNLGYLFVLKRNLILEPYFGRSYYFISEFADGNTENMFRIKGFNFSVGLSKWFLKEKVLCVFARSQITYTNLSSLNSEFGNYSYMLNIGIGGTIGQIK